MTDDYTEQNRQAYVMLLEERERQGDHTAFEEWITTLHDNPTPPLGYPSLDLFTDYQFDPILMTHPDCVTLASRYVRDTEGTPDQIPSVAYWVEQAVERIQIQQDKD